MFTTLLPSRTSARLAARPEATDWQGAAAARGRLVEAAVFIGIMAYLAGGLLSALGVF